MRFLCLAHGPAEEWAVYPAAGTVYAVKGNVRLSVSGDFVEVAR